MFGASRDIEKFLCVGTVMMLQIDPEEPASPRLKTVLRGWRIRHHLIFDYPYDDSGRPGILDEGQPCVLRFLIDGWACAFDSTIVNWDMYRSTPHLRVKWPESFARTSFRKAERVNVRIACMAGDEAGVLHAVEIQDLSVGGCRIHSARIFAEGSILTLDFEAPDNFVFSGVRVLIRNVREGNTGYHLGCEIIPGQDAVCNDIEFLVNTTLAKKRTATEQSEKTPVVLIIDDAPDVYEKLSEALKNQPVDVVWAGNALDGMCRLRMLSPVAVLMDSHLPHIESEDFCRIVRNVNGFSQLPMYVFDEDAPEVGEKIQRAGATGFFGPHQCCMDELVNVAVGALRTQI